MESPQELVVSKIHARRMRRLVVGVVVAAFLATAVIAAVNWRPIAARWTTSRAYEDAVAMVGANPIATDNFEQKVLAVWIEKHGGLLRHALLDRGYLADRLPPSAVTPEALPWWLVVFGGYYAQKTKLNSLGDKERDAFVFQEIQAWLPYFIQSTGAKEALVRLLTEDYTMFAKPDDEWGGLPKNGLIAILQPTHRERADSYYQAWESRLLAIVTPSQWQTLLEQSRNANLRVRAGCLLLLMREPNREIFLERAREALKDPAPWVRIASAGTLAWQEIPEGVEILIEGFKDPRWEIRYFCARSLALIGDPRCWEAIAAQASAEQDAWVVDQLKGWATDRKLR